ncbi:hypothetical protein [Nitrosophilus alvini]|uniref:hypothetical protein n=1 Tax=Nitrosophilus alvini TaxID=2714855 RepID=UPI00190DC78E|nr:hypothetical protein [Nitrosophilus alvini]
MKKILIKELFIYIAIFLFLAIGMHFKEWISHPVEHIKALPSSEFGPLHPFLFAFGGYIFILIIRLFVKIIRKAINR